MAQQQLDSSTLTLLTLHSVQTYPLHMGHHIIIHLTCLQLVAQLHNLWVYPDYSPSDLAQTMQQVNLNSTDQSWYMDSGLSTHLTVDPGKISSPMVSFPINTIFFEMVLVFQFMVLDIPNTQLIIDLIPWKISYLPFPLSKNYYLFANLKFIIKPGADAGFHSRGCTGKLGLHNSRKKKIKFLKNFENFSIAVGKVTRMVLLWRTWRLGLHFIATTARVIFTHSPHPQSHLPSLLQPKINDTLVSVTQSVKFWICLVHIFQFLVINSQYLLYVTHVNFVNILDYLLRIQIHQLLLLLTSYIVILGHPRS